MFYTGWSHTPLKKMEGYADKHFSDPLLFTIYSNCFSKTIPKVISMNQPPYILSLITPRDLSTR